MEEHCIGLTKIDNIFQMGVPSLVHFILIESNDFELFIDLYFMYSDGDNIAMNFKFNNNRN